MHTVAIRCSPNFILHCNFYIAFYHIACLDLLLPLIVCCLFVLVDLVSVVYIFVLFKIVLLCKSLLADITLEVLCSAMGFHVLSEIAFIVRGMFADVAVDRFSCVLSHVFF